MAKKRLTGGVTEKGYRLGEYHHRAKLFDVEVDQIRDIHEAKAMTYDELAEAYGVSRWTIKDIVTYRCRATTPTSYRSYFKDTPEKR